ncbi:MAG: DMT family transporter [Thermaerobacter sp.]|nr:DMT family transporter [Thermaerobacter sp.]
MSRRAVGVLIVLLSAALWGLSGTAAQVLFQDRGVSPIYLVTVRLWGAAALLLLAVFLRRPQSLRVDRGSLGQLAIFGLFGFFLVQYSYFAAIAAVGVATATFLQYLGPALIVLYTAAVRRRMPTAAESIALLLAVGGTGLLVLGGGPLRITTLGIGFGLLSAVSLAFYTIYPTSLVQRLGPWTTSGYGFLFGAISATLLLPLGMHSMGRPGPQGLLLIAFVIVLGTLVPFALYVAALRHLSPSEVGIAATAEPLSAAASSYFLLGQALLGWQYVGGALIIGAVLVLAAFGGRSTALRVERTGVIAGGRPDP